LLRKIFGSGKGKKEEVKRPSIKRQNPNDAILFCAIQKSGSTWVNNVLHDIRVYEYTGLEAVAYSDIQEKIQDAIVPEVRSGIIFTRLYLDYSTYKQIEKPEKFKTIYLTRDPRDITVSWYFSAKYSHAENRILAPIRKVLNELSEHDGLMYSIRHLADSGSFAAQRSWIGADKDDARIKLYNYETLLADETGVFRDIFNHCDIDMPEDVFSSLIRDHSFKTVVKRDRGTEDKKAHLRKGISGDWRNYFSDECVALFKERTGDLLVAQGYEKDLDWGL